MKLMIFRSSRRSHSPVRRHGLSPLTPALSLREREHHCQRLKKPLALGQGERMSVVHPLPEGEGRGEGERGSETESNDLALSQRTEDRRALWFTFHASRFTLHASSVAFTLVELLVAVALMSFIV